MNVMAKSSTRGARVGLAVFAVAAVAFVAIAWFLHNFHRVEREFDLPPRGEAAYNPLYALKKSLQADGIRVDSRQRLNLAAHALDTRDTLLIYSDPRSLSPPEVDRVLDWVEGGGHLVVRTPGWRDGNDDVAIALFDELGVVLEGEDGSRDCMPFQVEGEKPHVEFCGSQRFTFIEDEVPELAWGDLKNGYVYARQAWGDGHVDVLADFDFLTNGNARGGLAGLFGGGGRGEGLREATHVVLARQVLAPNYGHGTAHLVYAAQMPSLWRVVFTRGWMVWLPLALALCAWLWLRTQRFGPLRPAPAPERRSLLEHVRASGDLLFRYGKGAMLYMAVREAFLSRLRRRDPLAAALTGEAQADAIAKRLQVAPNAVLQALQVPASHDKPAFRERISLLIKLRNQL